MLLKRHEKLTADPEGLLEDEANIIKAAGVQKMGTMSNYNHTRRELSETERQGRDLGQRRAVFLRRRREDDDVALGGGVGLVNEGELGGQVLHEGLGVAHEAVKGAPHLKGHAVP
ncbi:hypothetical protein EYF80_043628 [Liparis tanakae]|uniref:Uncharacterized protein n=1 Tax=Liparis tanakae TaxID=230148 RepID=A0A4Z2FYU4_9TELE|nr:hypothetical protein EYF80_043628 [Liparis tanakae]